MERGIQEIELPGGQTVLAAVRVLEPGALPDEPSADYDFEDTGALDRLGARLDQFNELVSGVGSAVLDAALAARPDEVSATFGIEIAVKPGKAVAMLADGEVKAAISVTLTWRPGRAGPHASTGHGESEQPGRTDAGQPQSVPAQQPPPAGQPGPAQGGHVLPGQAQPGAGSAGPGPPGAGSGGPGPTGSGQGLQTPPQ